MKETHAPIPLNEKERLQALLDYNILDTLSEEYFDNITQLASHICQTPIASISLIDDKRQWFKSRIGLAESETPKEISFCQYAIMGNDIFEVPNALEDERFQNNPLVTGSPDIRFYAGAPLTSPDGFNIGTLCVIDNMPKLLDDEQKKALSTLAKSVIAQLELKKKNLELKNEVDNLAKKALETITHELNSYKSALDLTSSVVITDKNGIITFVNDAACNISKYSKEELIGQNIRIFNSGFHPKEFFIDLWQTITAGLVWKKEVKNKTKDVKSYWADTTIVPFVDEKGKPDRYVSISQNISKQKISENKLQQFFNISQDYLCVINTAGYFENLSPTFSRELGFSDEELTSKPFLHFVHQDDIDSSQKEIDKLAQGINTIHFEARFKCKGGGNYKLLSWNASYDKEMGLLYATARDITLSKKINEENKRLSLVAKGTDNIIIMTDKYRRIEWVNEPFVTLTGYSLEEVIGKKPGKILQYEETDKNTILQIREALNKETSFKGEIKNRSKSGRKYWLEISISPIFNDKHELINFIAIESDITEKKRKDLNIANLMASQNAIFNGVSYSVIFTDVNGIIKRINKVGLEMLEYTAEELINKLTPIDFHDPAEIAKRAAELTAELGQEVKPGLEVFVAKIKENDSADSHEWTYISKSGRRIPVWLSFTCIRNTDGNILGYLGVAEDYTIKKQAELDLINAKNLAEQAVYAKDSFLANMSHEIRTPLNAIIGFTELISQSNLDSTQREFISNIQMAGDNLLHIINDILDLSKIESGQLVIESYPFNIKATLKHIYELLKVKTAKNNLDFSLLLDADMPEFVVGDKGRLNQIMMNLVGNAVKFTKEGEVTISVKKVDETDSHVTLKFSVKDTGIGIPADKLSLIFERFTQAEASTTRTFGGTGLGLNIVKQLVELQNGQIQVKSTLGQGSDFYFSLIFPKVESSYKDASIENDSNKKSSRKLSILLCEDNELNQRLAKTIIQKFGFDLDIAVNGEEGLKLLSKNHYDLILMDLQMPVKDGYQTTIHIRNVLKLEIPIIAMTAHSLVGEQQKCFEIGMNAYVAKPFKQQELLNKIYEVVETGNKNPIENAIENQSLSTETRNKKSIDFSYFESLGEAENESLKKEMVEIFIDKVPNDLSLLEKAIEQKAYNDIQGIAHDMQSSLSMFRLMNEVEYLEKVEKGAKNESLTHELTHEFVTFKQEVNDVIDLLKRIKSTF
ncbi:multi-sensor hybrid histidine kinase (plasmid) [Emticicia oligotrophica DSM 17448]|uniref:histidine kinase n=1 Tax=Emticicia oligotrophica (strain DSM 17448 / CIP 109782 / MTCC 6937 / GPTSA100-15) TaxID=929562 RepID=A0ABM5N7X8_EMTOG|nr:PAS domain S-box protein [Emticicia oligotrophica]AFK05571.1 multi-sensor hybrid histidine kinase [Emticicia oligotrophica DSM 17448]